MLVLRYEIDSGTSLLAGADEGRRGAWIARDQAATGLGTLAGPVQAHVAANLIEHIEGAEALFQGEGGQQQVVADGVDDSRDALTAVVDFTQEFFREDGLIGHASLVHAAMDVFNGLLHLKGRQIAAQNDALLELSQIGSVELSVEFGLTAG